MDTDAFVISILRFNERFRESFGISSVYAYSARGNFIRAVGTVVLGAKSPLTDGWPRVVNLYLVRGGRVVGISDLRAPMVDGEAVGQFEVLNDIAEPPSRVLIMPLRGHGLGCVDQLGSLLDASIGVAMYREGDVEEPKVVYVGRPRGFTEISRVIVALSLASCVRGLCENSDELLRRARWALGVIERGL